MERIPNLTYSKKINLLVEGPLFANYIEAFFYAKGF